MSTQHPNLILYHFRSCPFCMMVRRAIQQLGMEIEERDIRVNREYFDELMAGGGKSTVPCLRIEKSSGDVEWMYESADIIDYLKSICTV